MLPALPGPTLFREQTLASTPPSKPSDPRDDAFIREVDEAYREDEMKKFLVTWGRWILLAGCLTGLAFLTTIKIVLYAPAFAAVAWLRWHQTGDRAALIRQGLGFTLAALAFSAVPTFGFCGRILAGSVVFGLGELPSPPSSAGFPASTACKACGAMPLATEENAAPKPCPEMPRTSPWTSTDSARETNRRKRPGTPAIFPFPKQLRDLDEARRRRARAVCSSIRYRMSHESMRPDAPFIRLH